MKVDNEISASQTVKGSNGSFWNQASTFCSSLSKAIRAGARLLTDLYRYAVTTFTTFSGSLVLAKVLSPLLGKGVICTLAKGMIDLTFSMLCYCPCTVFAVSGFFYLLLFSQETVNVLCEECYFMGCFIWDLIAFST